MSPSCSSVLSCIVSIRCVVSGRSRCSSLNRIGPFANWFKIAIFHLPLTKLSTISEVQRYVLSLNVIIFQHIPIRNIGEQFVSNLSRIVDRLFHILILILIVCQELVLTQSGLTENIEPLHGHRIILIPEGLRLLI